MISLSIAGVIYPSVLGWQEFLPGANGTVAKMVSFLFRDITRELEGLFLSSEM